MAERWARRCGHTARPAAAAAGDAPGPGKGLTGVSQTQWMFGVHCAGLPLPAARFPPPSVTPETAAIPHRPLLLAELAVIVVAGAPTLMPSIALTSAALPETSVPVAGVPTTMPTWFCVAWFDDTEVFEEFPLTRTPSLLFWSTLP